MSTNNRDQQTAEARPPYFTIMCYYAHIYSTIPCQLFSNLREYWEENWRQMNDMHASWIKLPQKRHISYYAIKHFMM